MKNNLKKMISFVMVLCMLASLIAVPSFAAELKNIVDLTFADYEKIYFTGETDKDFTSYEVGEKMIFTVSLNADGEQITAPYFYYTLRGDDGISSSGYVEPDADGYAVIEASVSECGAVRLVVQPCDFSKNVITADNITKFEGGAIAGASGIQTTVAEPLDFDEYWASQIERLDGVAPDLLYIEQVDSGNSAFDAYIVKIDCIGDPDLIATGETWVTGVLSVPKDASAGSLKFRLNFQGYGVNSATVSNVKNFVTFNVCAHSMEQLRESSYYSTSALGLTNYGFHVTENAVPETSYFNYMLLRDVQAVRFLQKYFGSEGVSETVDDIDTGSWKGLWNGTDIETRGGSQGGFQAISVAALVPEVTYVNANVPWFADVAGNTDPTRIQSTFRPTYADGLRYFDTAIMAKRVKADTVDITAGNGDTLCPMYAVQAIYNNLTTNASLRFRQGATHSRTNTTAVDFYQTKVASDASAFGTDGFVVNDTKVVNCTAFADAWKKLTGRDVIFYDDLEAMVASSDVDSKNLISITYATIYSDETVDQMISSFEEQMNIYGIDNCGMVFLGDISELTTSHRAMLKMAADPDSAVHMLAFGEDKMSSEELALNLSSSIYNNQIIDDVTVKIIGIDGSESIGFTVTDDTSVISAFPVVLPYYAMKNSNITTEYEAPADTGEEYGIIKVKGDGFAEEIKVYNTADVSAYGEGWLIKDGTLSIYSFSDEGMGWNSHMDRVNEVVINEGIYALPANALNVNSGTVVTLPFSLETIDANAFGGETDFTIKAYDVTVGATFAEENSIEFVSLGAANVCGDGVYWKYKDGTLNIFGTGSVLNSGVGGYGASQNSVWYEYYDEITKVVIGENVKTIGNHAFHYMPNLTTVEITPNLTAINQGAFQTCQSLSTVYVKGNERVVGTIDLSYVTSIGTYVFDHARAMDKYILSPNLRGTIGTETFKANGKVTEMEIPASVSGIGAEAFDSCDGLRTLTVLGKETTISPYAFANASSASAVTKNYIANITIVAYSDSAAHQFAKDNMMVFMDIETGEITDYASIVEGEVVETGDLCENITYSVIKNEGEETYTLAILGAGTSITTGVEDIDGVSALPYAKYSDKITKVINRSAASNLGAYVFASLTALTEAEISDKITVIDEGAFALCTSLTSVYVGDGNKVEGTADISNILTLGKSAFEGTAISTVAISKAISSIPEDCFCGSALTEITLSARVKTVGASAFENCNKLAAVRFDATDYILGENALTGLADGAVITAYDETPAHKVCEDNGYVFNSLGEIPHTIEGNITGEYWNNLWVYDEKTKVLTITSNKTGWNETGNMSGESKGDLWTNFVGEIEEIICVGNIGKISQHAFEGAKNLKKITIPWKCAQFDGSAFAGCENLTEIVVETIPNIEGVLNLSNVSTLANKSNIFKGAASARAAIIGSSYSAEKPILDGTLPPNLNTIYGTGEYLESYCEEKGITFVPYGTCSSTAYWTIDGEILTVSGEGRVEGLNSIEAYADSVTKVVIEKGITAISDNAMAALGGLTVAVFRGDAPESVGTAVFGTQSSEFTVNYYVGADGFEGDTWNGYTLIKLNYLGGDVNGDGTVNTKDAVLLAQHLAGWSVEIVALAADCNGDGSINTKDAVLLAQYLAGWKVDLIGGSSVTAPDTEPTEGDIELDAEDIFPAK